MQLKVKVAPERPLIARLAHTLYPLQLLRIYADTLAWGLICSWSFDVCPKIYSNFTFASDYQIELDDDDDSDSMPFDTILVSYLFTCVVFCFLVFLFFCFLFSVSVFPFCFVYFRVVVIFYCFLVLFRLCVFYFHFLRNFIYFAVAAVAILHFALPLLPRSLSASASALLDPSFSISLHRPRSPALLLSCSVPPLAFSSCRLCAFCKLSWRQRRVSVQVPALQMSTHAARYTIRSCTPYCIRRVYWHLQSINTYR